MIWFVFTVGDLIWFCLSICLFDLIDICGCWLTFIWFLYFVFSDFDRNVWTFIDVLLDVQDASDADGIASDKYSYYYVLDKYLCIVFFTEPSKWMTNVMKPAYVCRILMKRCQKNDEKISKTDGTDKNHQNQPKHRKLNQNTKLKFEQFLRFCE